MTDAAETELPRGVALAWGVAANPQRGPKREMSVERIVEAAVEIADADGLAAVSMAAVAARLGYTPMSLYRYVTAKDDLVLLMQEEATGLPSAASRTAGTWRDRMQALYREQVQRYLEHPWVLDVPITGSPTTPNSAAWMDAGLHALAETPLTHEERLSVMLLVTGHARWTGMVLAGYARVQRERGVADVDITRAEDALFRQLITADAYPDLRAAIDAGVFLDESDPFSFNLDRSLDGVAAYIAEVEKGRRAERAPWGGLDDADIADDKKFREARKAVRQAEKALRDARRIERQVAREVRERRARQRPEK
ncbi:TetR/AcrR family transcriptional regulator C-terminal domain-containing protein [Microbacterium sp. CFH 31415]|uniref:TetR/AcrR family transcriptional regulator n=1 Tax=Microbacterium sp. CFH 31415 TaxID=2921732 RepID=UPI001F1362C7|nr:TetR/AcrR family transcriptional regulator C-terminal domain-containing protein [Microbacterium sp. CFH 31415]MCH6231062.1 TetR/AcrR family transcriptional regulator C-terminal domain-containing protein [Microbacterium sp. CFH 31415]